MDGIRTVHRLRNGFLWDQIDFKDLREGDIFKLFEPDGTPVVGNKGEIEFVADSNPFLNAIKVWQINVVE